MEDVRSLCDWPSDVSESRRWNEPYGLLSSSSHMVAGTQADTAVKYGLLELEVGWKCCYDAASTTRNKVHGFLYLRDPVPPDVKRRTLRRILPRNDDNSYITCR